MSDNSKQADPRSSVRSSDWLADAENPIIIAVAKRMAEQRGINPMHREPGSVPFCDENGYECIFTDGKMYGASFFYYWRMLIPDAAEIVRFVQSANRGVGITATDSDSTCHAKQQSDG